MIRSTLPLFALAFTMTAPALAAENVAVGRFNSLQLQGGGHVSVVPGRAQRVTIVEGSSRYTRVYVDRRGQLNIENCRVRCPSNYRLRIEVQSPTVPSLAINGGGDIRTGGFAAQSELAVAVNGGGRIDARGVRASDVSAAVNGGGELLVSARSSLSAAVRGGGAIRYWGNPAVNQVISGGGAVLRGN